jgi:hypothetical protein
LAIVSTVKSPEDGMQKTEARVVGTGVPPAKLPPVAPFASMYRVVPMTMGGPGLVSQRRFLVVSAPAPGQPKAPRVVWPVVVLQKSPVGLLLLAVPVTSGDRSTPKAGRGVDDDGQSWLVSCALVVVQALPAFAPPVHVLLTQRGQGWTPGTVSRSPLTYTLTVSGKVCVEVPVIALRTPPAAGVAAILLITHVLMAGAAVLGMGSGGPKKQPGAEQLRVLPVSVEVAGARIKAVGLLQLLMVKIVTALSGVGDGG